MRIQQRNLTRILRHGPATFLVVAQAAVGVCDEDVGEGTDVAELVDCVEVDEGVGGGHFFSDERASFLLVGGGVGNWIWC